MLRQLASACWFACKWGVLAALLAAVGLGLYFYSRLNDEIRQRIEAKFAGHYTNLRVTVRSAQLIDGQGIEIRGLSIRDPRATGPQAELAYFDEILLCCQTSIQELVQREPVVGRVIVRRPRFHAARRIDGSWSIAQMLPLPKFSDRSPEMTIENGQVVVFDEQRRQPTTFTLRDINLAIKPLFSDNPAERGLSEITGTLAADHVQRIELAGKLNQAAGIADITGSVGGIDIGPDLLAALPAEYADRTAPLAPLRGQGAVNFHVRFTAGNPQPLEFAVAGELKSGRFEDARLPQALADMQATFRANHTGLVIDDFSARNGPTTIRGSARVEGFHRGAPMVLEGEALHLLVGRQWEAILPEKLLVQWRKFLPAGEVHARGKLAFDGTRWQPEFSVQCLNVSFMFYKFPYRMERGTGRLELKDNHMTLDLAAFAGGRQVKIDGAFDNPGPLFTGAVEVRGEGLPIDQNLMAALPGKSREIVQSLNANGTFNFWLRTWRDDPRQTLMNQHLVVGLNRCSLRYEKFAYPLHNVSGKVEMVDGHWMFKDLTGENDTGKVACQGRLTPGPNGAELALDFTGRDVVLEEELRDALNPQMRKLWNDMRPKGSINLTAEVRYTTADKHCDVRTRLEPIADAVSIHPVCFPYRVEKLQGAINCREGRCDFENLRGLHERTPLSADGYCEYNPAGQWHLRFENVNVDRLRADRDLMNALPARLRKSVVLLNPEGAVAVRGSLDLWGDPPPTLADGTPVEVTGEYNIRSAWNVEFDMHQGTVQAGIPLTNIHGGVTLIGECDGTKVRSRGELNLDSVTWNGYQFTDVRGPLWIDDTQIILGAAAEPQTPGRTPRRISGKSYGGVVLADCFVRLDETPRYSVQAVVSDADLNRFCIEALPGKQGLTGKVLASIDVGGTAAGLHTLAGRGQVRLSDADIYELPVMVALLKVLNLRRPDTTGFTTSDVQFRIEGEHLLLDNIELSGDAISLVGKGEMNLNSEIRLTLHSLMGRSELQLPAWKTLMGGASEAIMQIHVTGTLANPVTTREAFPTLNAALQSLQAGTGQQRPLLPQGMRLFPRAEETQRR